MVEDEDLERVRLVRELRDLEQQHDAAIATAERKRRSRLDGGGKKSTGGTNWTLVKREAQQMLEYKQRLYVDLNSEKGGNHAGDEMKRLREDLRLVQEQIEGLESHLRKREGELQGVKREIDDAKASR